MISVIQRVRRAEVSIDGKVVGSIGRGLAVLTAVCREDDLTDIAKTATKLAGLRVFPSEKVPYDLDVKGIGGAILLVSNFTVAADTSSGRRPGFSGAMSPDLAKPVFEQLLVAVRGQGVPVETGEFCADMIVTIKNDGPVTVIFDSRK